MKQFSLMHCVKTFVACSFLLFSATPLFAQVKLPEVSKVTEKPTTINGTYLPKGEFLKNNPYLLKNGVYFFEYNQFPSNSFERNLLSGYYTRDGINSENFPATEEQSLKNLSTFGKILVQFTCDTNIGYNVVSSKQLNILRSAKNYNSQNETIDSSYYQAANEVLKKKGAQVVSISDRYTLEFNKDSYLNSNIILQFVYVPALLWDSKKDSDIFPSNALYKLIVKDISGNVIRNYGQVIFFDGESKAGTRIGDPLVLRTTFPIAMENLINRFLNDEATVQVVKYKIEDAIAAKRINPHQDSLFLYKQQYEYVRSKKQQLLFDLSVLKWEYISIANDNNAREATVKNRDHSWDANLIFSLSSAISNGIESGQMSKEIKTRLEAAQKKLSVFNGIAFSISQEEKKFIKETASVFDNPFDISFILASKENDDVQINNLFSLLSTQKNETSVAFEKTTKLINTDLALSYTNNLNNLSSFINSATVGTSATSSANPTAESMATTNGGNMDACMQKANSEWYKSPEYLRYKKTGLNSDASDCKAKLMELTAQYCGDKLPPNELATIKRQAAKERHLADQIRSANKFNYKP